MADNTYFGIATYNMHGFNNGSPGLLELYNNANIHIIALQEHWLHYNNLHLLNSLHPEFVGLCVSFMSEKLHTSVHYGRPYGGVCFLIRSHFFLNAKLVIKLPLADVYPLFCLWILV